LLTRRSTKITERTCTGEEEKNIMAAPPAQDLMTKHWKPNVLVAIEIGH